MCQCSTSTFEDSCGCPALDILESREMSKHIDWWAKHLQQVACVSQNLKCWGAWDTTYWQRTSHLEERGIQRKSLTIFLERTTKGHCQSKTGTVSKATLGKLLRWDEAHNYGLCQAWRCYFIIIIIWNWSDYHQQCCHAILFTTVESTATQCIRSKLVKTKQLQNVLVGSIALPWQYYTLTKFNNQRSSVWFWFSMSLCTHTHTHTHTQLTFFLFIFYFSFFYS